MRSAIIGAFFTDDPAKRREFVAAATRVTHTDPKALTAAMAVAEAAAWGTRGSESVEKLLQRLPLLGQDNEWQTLCRELMEALAQAAPVASFAESLGLRNGVSGYSYHSVPVALFAWLRHPADFSAALESGLNCGGDTDTVGAIIGALAGASCGDHGIPAAWLTGMAEWPRSGVLLRRVAGRLAEQKAASQPLGPVGYFWPGLIPRNLLFVAVVLIHGFRRLAPPY